MLIHHLMEFNSEVKLVTFALRLWGKQKGFVGSGVKINSYTMTLMVVFYLQTINVLPALSLFKDRSSKLNQFAYNRLCHLHIETYGIMFCEVPSDIMIML